MPEGDTVWRAARRLDAALAGETLLRSEFRVPHLATVDLSGRRLRCVAARGKHLLTRIDGGLTLHTHFRGRRWTMCPISKGSCAGPER
ncbi:hypothetical protein MXD95_004180 [Frankia sp. AiPa1]|nr:DNA-formamidopyrimidine glycosylase family protein [Frankia sp. AiPa1]MCL9758458.1 hypothetical protein [Frankia sp. AiPa1]